MDINRIIKATEKAGFTANQCNYRIAYYYDGTDHDFSYPCVILNGTSDFYYDINIIDKICKKYKCAKYSMRIIDHKIFAILMDRDDITKGKKGYGESVAFQYGFWMKKHEKPDATDAELIKAGHNELIKKGYTVSST